ncbi:PaaX family transcriptional regulator C-terminal domain-containing protein [Sinirhodobacter huangdaonensis]|uniref:PaaX family transcriptional regulator n=1 Tax=Paenirhodobacter huangdaonensis TaxID=2501515 RepID=A0A3S3M8L4_9RHOB|nr:PaaX family transcriptional regulator C-terminal domain-containing protein [Sinirhodobacter huangdaonensis]RWR51100.1 PaaX family transcriptional regulator [Sinirhodobacter huangdaonensis]
MTQGEAVAELTAGLTVTAASFIVTVYGDVVVPRGEVLWMGSLIGICARIGISENLVRTATSRLVAAGRLEGERAGRRSFYRLAPAARAEFSEAARLLYAPRLRPAGWLVLAAEDFPEETLRRFHLARMGGDLWICPDWGERPPGAALVLRCAGDDPAQCPGLARFWDLTGLAARYDAMVARFGPLAADLRAGGRLAPAEALTARLLLVHLYRGALLRDPLLPEAALPQGWSGAAAQALFRQLYLDLTPAAEVEIAAVLEDQDGVLPAATPASAARLDSLK